ncbi:TM0106 family RecB-like putative nuclease [Caenimonas soli]|uniref:TM0106 family RecB-like putative nuclease n=1 Tax=Caenimonas soli TaxID=2735555 RepID=UPI0015523377|nr:TM0106 family RecB-like putative nuclease [Caenimonas soli]NPC56682.1 TM0106 family RecB-like putative nuclease [Caenimonas soli]
MQRENGRVLISATDVVSFLECEYLTRLDWLHARGELGGAMRMEQDESAALISRKGIEHEVDFLRQLRSQALSVAEIPTLGRTNDQRVDDTRAAMASGPDVIYQATLRRGQLYGHADFLFRVDGRSSELGAWHYEVADTKLARSTKAKFLVQLAFYSDLLAAGQGAQPKRMHVILGDRTQRSFMCADYMHYFRALLARYEDRLQLLERAEAPEGYPIPCNHCDLCGWRAKCDQKRLDDDHLCQVAGIRQTQWNKLQLAGVATMAKLAALPEGAIVPKLNPETLAKLRSQAALQDDARRTGERRFLVLPLDPDGRRGFFRMPVPDPGDMFFDMEGDPLEPGGLEYLFGVGYFDGGWQFRAFWGHSRAEERVAFEQFMDFVVRRRREHPGGHIYHYASYEETALKRLASLHATREVEVDNLLREGALVDLYKVVREAIRISEPSYSIKYVEHFYRPAREGDVQNAGASIVFYERWRETSDPRLLADIEAYNRDDVESTRQLREWLLTHRPAGVAWKPRVAVDVGDASPEGKTSKAGEAEERLIPYRQQLLDELPADDSARTVADRASELTYQLLDFHRRADKPAWWALYARRDMTEDELLEDPECLGGLTLLRPPEQENRSLVYTYLAPDQETKLATGDGCTRADTGQGLGTLTFDESSRQVRLKIGPRHDPLPDRLSIGPAPPIPCDPLVNALYRFADSQLAGDGKYLALKRYLLREAPRLSGRPKGQLIIADGADLLERSLAAVQAMDHTCLYVQGPPGSGKTYTGSRMIAHLLARGWRVGVMSNSHKAINHLLAGVMKVLAENGQNVPAVKKASATNPDSEFVDPVGGVANVQSNKDVWASGARLVAGTAWLFADAAADQKFDALFVDEAGQVALANLIAAGTCARNIVLLGDQMQLSQPVQGVHPGRSGDSALDYLLDGEATIAPDRGIFLKTSWRMHPLVCRFISDAVYDGRLEAESRNARRMLLLHERAHPDLRPAGIVHVPVKHEGCSQGCEAEAAVVAAIYTSALEQRYTDEDGVEHAMTPDNILVMAPYNVQVNLLKRTLPPGARVGTVDKFQGQEAELVIVSMTTSSEQDLPRNIEFLYSRNRLNVAISRAKCQAIVLANPALMAIKCKTPEQMALVNLLCWVAAVGS